jgi:hypothetical protein
MKSTAAVQSCGEGHFNAGGSSAPMSNNDRYAEWHRPSVAGGRVSLRSAVCTKPLLMSLHASGAIKTERLWSGID